MRTTLYMVRVTITCPKCGTEDWREENDLHFVPEPNEMFKELEADGWGHDDDLCLACRGADRLAKDLSGQWVPS